MSRGFAGGFVVSVVAAVCIVIVEAEQPSPARTGAYVVQLAGPVLESWKAALVEAGADIHEYVPQFAFRVRMTPDAAARVRRLDFVSSVSPIRAEHKLAPRLRRNGALPYVVRLERGAVAEDVETALRGAGAQVLRRGSQLLIVADSSLLDRLAAIDGLASIDNFTPRIKHNEFGGGVIMGSDVANANGFDGSSQTIAIADTGLGFGTAASAHADIAASRISAIFNWPGVPDVCFETIANDGAQDVDTGHGTHVATAALGAGNAGGAGRGTAPAATLVFQAIENYAVPSLLCSLIYGLTDGYYLVGLPDDLGDLFNQAYQQDARVHSNSWGSEVAGAYSVDSENADAFVWAHRDLTVTFSAGNSGADADADGIVDPETINAPGTAKNVITVGASENDRQSHWECDASLTYTTCASQGGQNSIFPYGSGWPERYAVNPLKDDPSAGNAEQMAAFSSRGPTSDGRIKPDVVAPGTWNLSGYSTAFQQQYDGAPNPAVSAYQYDGWGFPASASYKYMGGTSMAAPLVAGGAAVVRDFYLKSRGHQASAALVKAVLINSAVDLLDENNDGILDNANPIPNIHEGWGRVHLVNATDASDTYFDEAASLTTSTTASHTFDVTSPGVPMKVTLAWTDYPASTSAATALVNDLDLTVTSPDGTVYRGNVFSGGWSLTGGSADRLNNVENVYVFAAAAGTWTIDVSGYNVPNGPQSFALIVDSVGTGSGLPMVRLTVDDGAATEAGPTPGVFRVSRSGDTASALEVTYTVSGTATSGSDFAALSGSVTIPVGAVDATITVDAIDDQLYEPSETVIVTVNAAAPYTIGSPSSGQVTITSDDLPPDLTIFALSVPTSGAAGSTITATLTTRNIGSGASPASRTGLYLSLNSSWNASDTFIGDVAVGQLGSGATENATVGVEIPAATAAGSYYVIAKADWAGSLGEVSETNNTKYDVIKIGPDLLVTAVSVPSTAVPGGSINVIETTKNQGGATAGESTTAFYLSPNTSFDAADVPLGSRTVAPLGPNTSHQAATAVIIPSSTGGGTYYVLAVTDSAAVVAEYVETNNLKASGQIRIGADLLVTALTAPTDVAAGQTFEVGDTTANAGNAGVAETFTRFYLSTNNSLGADTLLGGRVVPALDAGASNNAVTSLTIPAGTPAGIYYLFAAADNDHEFPEMSESNNTKYLSIDVGPDLIIASITSATAAAPGGLLSVTDTTQNAGAGTAPASVTSFFLSWDSTFSALTDIAIGTRDVPMLEAGQKSIETTLLTVPAGTPPFKYYVIAKADHAAAVAESHDSNNTKTIASIMRVGADLVVTALTAPSTVVRGTPFTIADTTRNDGSEAGQTTTSVYLSLNTTLDAGDLPLATRSVGVLQTDISDSGQVTVVIPAGHATGNYYIIAKADDANSVTEATETNNTKYKLIKVNP